jgi:hypothetical protein
VGCRRRVIRRAVMRLKKVLEMNDQINYHSVDRVVFSIANLLNIIMVVIFFSRIKGLPRLEVVGLVWVAFIILLTIVVVLNIKGKREWWEIVIPLFLISFLILEVALDYILKLDFRNTRLLGPYLLMYYLSIMGMIGYSFRIGKAYGFVTLATYFLSQIAAFYSYFNVGHG